MKTLIPVLVFQGKKIILVHHYFLFLLLPFISHQSFSQIDIISLSTNLCTGSIVVPASIIVHFYVTWNLKMAELTLSHKNISAAAYSSLFFLYTRLFICTCFCFYTVVHDMHKHLVYLSSETKSSLIPIWHSLWTKVML